MKTANWYLAHTFRKTLVAGGIQVSEINGAGQPVVSHGPMTEPKADQFISDALMARAIKFNAVVQT